MDERVSHPLNDIYAYVYVEWTGRVYRLMGGLYFAF